MILLPLAAIALLLLVSAFFAGSETALTAVSRGRMHQLEKDGSKSAHHVNALVANREKLIGSVLLGNTFINILASSLATETLAPQLGERAVLIVTAGMTMAVLFFAEVLPKTLAIARTDRFALAVAWPLRIVITILSPIVSAVQFLVWRLLFLFGVRPHENGDADAAHDEIRGAVALHHQEGTVEREHRDMIDGVLDLRELRVGDVFMHRKHMTAIDMDQPRDAIIQAVMESEHTRLPLWRDEPENIIGILNTKHLAQALVERRGDYRDLDIAALATPPWFVPDTTRLEELLAAFRSHRSQFALVVDEYGALQGLVTLEDVLAEVIGELPDESQAEQRSDVRRRPDGSYLVDGTVPVRDLNRELDWSLPEEDATTIAGLVIQEAHAIPEPGQRFAFFGYTFEVLRRQRNQITALRVTPPKKTPPPA